MKKANISIFGLGYVGVVNLACFSDLGYNVFGCDIKSQKVDSILNGKSPINEPKVNQMIQQGLESKKIMASTNANEALDFSDVVIICVGTPSEPNGSVNLDFTINTTIEIGDYLKSKSKKITLIYRSTIPPGTIDQTIIPILKEKLGTKFNDLDIFFVPEFLREGTAVSDFYEGSRIVVGSNEESDKTLINSIFGYNSDIPIINTNYKTSEFIKYVDNTFHALKVSFANEVYSIGAKLGTDVDVANRAFLMDTQLNISPYYLKAGMPYGGSCLPKDVRAINHLAEISNTQAPLINSITDSNEAMFKRVFEKITAFGEKKILIAGLTFKKNTDDVRESPFLIIASELIKNGYDISIYDEDIDKVNLRISNPEIIKYLTSDFEHATKSSKLIVLFKNYSDLLINLNEEGRKTVLNCTSQKIMNLPAMFNQVLLYS